MTISFTLKPEGAQRTRAYLRDLSDQIPFVTAVALNSLGFKDIVPAESLEVQKTFDRPKPFVVKAFTVLKRNRATKKKLYAEVTTKDVFRTRSGGESTLEGVLNPHILGGKRRLKSSEKRLRQIGVLKADEWMVPTRVAPKDQYGNVRPGVYQEILAFFGGYTEAGFTTQARRRRANKAGERVNRKGNRFFIRYLGNNRAILEQRKNGQVNVLFLLTRAPLYTRRFDFFGVGQRTAARRYRKRFDEAIDFAIANPRKTYRG